MTSALPCAAGIGLRAPHVAQVLREKPAVPWFEVHSENYFADGGPELARLEAIRQHYPLSLHGVGLSLGGTDPLDLAHVRRLRALAERVEPAAISDHLCWSSVDGRWLNDLLPLPYTREALNLVCDRVDQVQSLLGRRLLVENVSSYVRLPPDDMPEWQFCAELARRTGCQLLLDVNNIYVSACNHGFVAADFLAGIPRGAVGEIHLAGHEACEGLLIDTHSRPVAPAVWALYEQALARFGALPTLIEWDQDIPAFSLLQAEAATAERYMTARRAAS